MILSQLPTDCNHEFFGDGEAGSRGTGVLLHYHASPKGQLDPLKEVLGFRHDLPRNIV